MNWKHAMYLLGVYLTPASALYAATPSATDAAAASPTVSYRSAFEGYRPFKEEAVTDWRALNDEVGRVGGHVGIMGGAGGHGAHGSGAAKPAAVTTDGGQPPVRGAPKAPAGDAHKH